MGLCFYPGENSRSLCFNLAADCCGGSASTAAVQGTRAGLSVDPSCCNGSGFCGLSSKLCVSSRKDLCSQCCSEQLLHMSVCSPAQFLQLGFGRLPSCSLPSHLHFGSLFFTAFSVLPIFHPLLLLPSFLHLLCLSMVIHLLLTPLNSIFKKCCCLSVRIQSKTIFILFLLFIFITRML